MNTELPKLLESAEDDASVDALLDWVTTERSFLEAELLQHGALLLRGYELGSIAFFGEFCDGIGLREANYVGGGSPRTKLTRNLYTTTHYPQQQHIPLHIECSYLPNIPKRLFFCCVTPATDRGQTPVGDMRLVLKQIDPAVRDKFERLG